MIAMPKRLATLAVKHGYVQTEEREMAPAAVDVAVDVAPDRVTLMLVRERDAVVACLRMTEAQELGAALLRGAGYHAGKAVSRQVLRLAASNPKRRPTRTPPPAVRVQLSFDFDGAA